MSIRKRGHIWWMRFTAPDGREIRESAQTTDRRAAQELHDRRKAELWRQVKLGEPPRHTWQEAVVRWMEEHPHYKRLDNNACHLRHAHPVLGSLYLDEITRDGLGRLVALRRQSGNKISTIAQSLSSVRTVLNAAVDWGWLAVAPRIQIPAVPQRRTRWLTREEADRLLAELPPHLAAMARFSLATGLREQNVCRLEWRQLDLERRVGWFYGDQMKAGRAMGIPLNADALIVLREQWGQHPQWVFPHPGGRPRRRANTVVWRNALRRAGIADFRWHDLRHTWASWHVQAGTPMPVLKELGGWSSLEMVLRYAHLGAEHLAEHAERIAKPRLVRTNSGTAPEKIAATGSI
jgi:integrase